MHIQSANLYLRPYVLDDAPAFHQAVNTSLPQLSQWMSWAQTPSTLESATATILRFQQEAAAGKKFPLAVFLNNGTFIGSSGFWPLAEDIFEIGYWLDTRFTGKGHMTEAVIAQCQYLINGLTTRLEIHCHPQNHNSMKVALNAGFKFEQEIPNDRTHVDGTSAGSKIFVYTP